MTGSIENVIEQRLSRRGLTGTLDKLRYANNRMFEPLDVRGKRVLYVGVGHGLDAVLALKDLGISDITGVDPFIGQHGNDEQDYNELKELVKSYDLESRFSVIKCTIQDWVAAGDDEKRYDVIVCNDVLHHIICTKKLLSNSKYLDEGINIFSGLRAISQPGGALIIGEPERNGLRQLLNRMGLIHQAVDYTTKQPHEQWLSVAVAGGWMYHKQRNYIPWAFRNQKGLWSGRLGRYTLCDKYYLYLENSAE